MPARPPNDLFSPRPDSVLSTVTTEKEILTEGEEEKKYKKAEKADE